MKSAPSASTEEKRRMMELLKRFEEDALDESPLLDDWDNEDEDAADDLQRRLQNIDLGTLESSFLRHFMLLKDIGKTRHPTTSCGTRSPPRSARSSCAR